MDNNQYVQEAMRTMSDKWYGAEIPTNVLFSALYNAEKAATQLDGVKKALFYGKNVSAYSGSNAYGTIDTSVAFGMATAFSNEGELAVEKAQVLLHGLIGVITEAGELATALLNTMADGQKLDKVNVIEECGDILWYIAAIAHALGAPIDAMQVINIAKLKERYGDAFSESSANVRSLDAERETLQLHFGEV